jgi:GTPase SAR1 family protein
MSDMSLTTAGQPSLSKDAIRRYAQPALTCVGCESRLELPKLISNGRKLVIVGDGACGKTSLCSVFTLGYFPKVSPSEILVQLTN